MVDETRLRHVQLVRESRLHPLLPDSRPTERLEASGVLAKDGKYFVVFDDRTAVAAQQILDSLSQFHALSRTPNDGSFRLSNGDVGLGIGSFLSRAVDRDRLGFAFDLNGNEGREFEEGPGGLVRGLVAEDGDSTL